MMSGDVSLFIAFAAGLLSFLSPCVLPLIPSYLSILGGVGLGAPGQKRFRLLRCASAFILGFSLVFITMGILVSTTFFLMGGISVYITRISGVIVIILGLNVIFDFLSFLNYEKRPFLKNGIHRKARQNSALRDTASAFIAGAAFGTGWTPCIGPVLTGILFMAGTEGKTLSAVIYLIVYSAGLGLPFLAAAVFFDFFVKNASRLRAHIVMIRRISGVLLVIIGIMILTGKYSSINMLIQRQISEYILWAETKAFPFRILANFLSWVQSF